MKCPACQVEGRITSNKIVRRKDGTFAYKMEITCRNKQCPEYGKVVAVKYNPVEITDDNE